MPTFILETPEIPVSEPIGCKDGTNQDHQTTVNLTKVELPVKRIVSCKRIQPSGTLLNPGSLEYYCQFAEVEKLCESKL